MNLLSYFVCRFDFFVLLVHRLRCNALLYVEGNNIADRNQSSFENADGFAN